MSKKITYVTIEPINGSPRIRGEYDSWLCKWQDLLHYVEEYLESYDVVQDGEAKLKFTFHQLTDAQYRKYCEDHGIEEW